MLVRFLNTLWERNKTLCLISKEVYLNQTFCTFLFEVFYFFSRDFKNTSNDEDSDSDYEPDVKPRVKRSHKEKTEVVDQHEKILGVTVHKRPGKLHERT